MDFIVGITILVCFLNGTKIEGVVRMVGPALVSIETQKDIGLQTFNKNMCVIKQ